MSNDWSSNETYLSTASGYGRTPTVREGAIIDGKIDSDSREYMRLGKGRA